MFDNTYPENVPEIFKLADEQVKNEVPEEDEEEIVYTATLAITDYADAISSIDYVTVMNKAAKKAEKKQRKKEEKALKKAQHDQYKKLVAEAIERRRKMFHILDIIKPNKDIINKNQISTGKTRNKLIKYKTKVEMLRKKMSSLDIRKNKDARKFAEYNIEIKDLEEEINNIEEKTGIHETVEKRSGFKFMINNAFDSIRKKAKQFKKFVRKNKELVAGILAIAIPSILSMLCKSKSSQASS